MTNGMKIRVREILENPLDCEWSLQGLGMLRTYLDPDRHSRLHVWHSGHRYEAVSELHTHPWDMVSTVYAGEIKQVRYLRSTAPAPSHMEQKILCGEGGGLCSAAQPVFLVAQAAEYYREGESYAQGWEEIHSSHPLDGTVTLVERQFTSDPDHAFVYYPHGEEWVTAEPRPATRDEIRSICSYAVRRWL